MSHIGRIRVSVDIGRPLELGCVGVPSPHVTGLELLKLLLGAKLVGLRPVSRAATLASKGVKLTMACSWGFKKASRCRKREV